MLALFLYVSVGTLLHTSASATEHAHSALSPVGNHSCSDLKMTAARGLSSRTEGPERCTVYASERHASICLDECFRGSFLKQVEM